MTRSQQPGISLFAVGLLGLGVVTLIFGDFALVWQPVAAWIPGRTALAYVTGVLELGVGAGLLFESTVKWSVRVLFPGLVLWALLKVPAMVVGWRIEGVWLGMGELTLFLAGGWTLFAELGEVSDESPLAWLAGERGLRLAQILLGISVIPIGLSHLVYGQVTANYVPAWLPYRIGWAYLTGAGQMASGLGLLFGVWRRVAAWAEAWMIALFTLLVWAPTIFAAPQTRMPWTAFFISWSFCAAAWVVAQNVVPQKAAERGVVRIDAAMSSASRTSSSRT